MLLSQAPPRNRLPLPGTVGLGVKGIGKGRLRCHSDGFQISEPFLLWQRVSHKEVAQVPELREESPLGRVKSCTKSHPQVHRCKVSSKRTLLTFNHIKNKRERLQVLSFNGNHECE